MALLDPVTTDPAILGGLPCIRDTRILLSVVRGYIDDGARDAEILAEYSLLLRSDLDHIRSI